METVWVDKFLGIYVGKCSECKADSVPVMNDPAGFQVPFCQDCYEEVFYGNIG